MIKFNHKAAVTAMLINHIPSQSQTEPQFFHDKTIQVSNSAPLKVNGMGCTFLKPGFLIKKLKNLAKKTSKVFKILEVFLCQQKPQQGLFIYNKRFNR